MLWKTLESNKSLYGSPRVASPLLPSHRGCDDDKKREETRREEGGGCGERVKGLIPHQLVLCVVQPVHEFGRAGGPIVSGHSVAFPRTWRCWVLPAEQGV